MQLAVVHFGAVPTSPPGAATLTAPVTGVSKLEYAASCPDGPVAATIRASLPYESVMGTPWLPAAKTTTTPRAAAAATASEMAELWNRPGTASPSDRLTTLAPLATAKRMPAATASGLPVQLALGSGRPAAPLSACTARMSAAGA